MTDQEKFDQDVNRVGRLLFQSLAGVGIVAALMMSAFALASGGDSKTTTVLASAPAAPAVKAVPMSATATIDHVMRGCHTLVVNGGRPNPSQTLHLGTGAVLHVQDNDIMPHHLVQTAGPKAAFAGAAMNHMGASGTVTFPAPGTYSLTTKAGEDYMKGVSTVGPDNTLHITVIVA